MQKSNDHRATHCVPDTMLGFGITKITQFMLSESLPSRKTGSYTWSVRIPDDVCLKCSFSGSPHPPKILIHWVGDGGHR